MTADNAGEGETERLRRLWRLVCSLHSAPQLVPRIPRTLHQVIRSLMPGGGGVRGSDLVAFGALDIGFRPWYAKIAEDQRTYGRNGYVWDDGFGLSMGVRFYNNSITYALYRWLGLRAYVALSVAAFLGAACIPLLMQGRVNIAVAVLLVILPSPLFIAAQFHRGKPELLWMALMPPLLLSVWSGHWLAAGLLFSVVAMANFAVAFQMGLTLALVVPLWWPGWSRFGLLVLGATPGLVKTAVRLMPFLRAGMLRSLAREQTNAVVPSVASPRARAVLIRKLLYYSIVYLLALGGLLAAAPEPVRFLILGAGCLAVFWVGQTRFYLNDPQSFWMWHLALAVALLALFPSWSGVAGLLVFMFLQGRVVDLPIESRFAHAGKGSGVTVTPAFPHLEAVSRAAIEEPLRQFFAPVPDGSRVLMESRSNSRDFSGYRAFLVVAENVLAARAIEIVPDEYVRISALSFYNAVLARFNADAPPALLRSIVTDAGASCVLVHDPALLDRLEADGSERLAVLSVRALPHRVLSLLRLPSEDLHLLRSPVTAGIVVPQPAEVRRVGGGLEWSADAARDYLVRYAWDRHMRAYQSDRVLPVDPVPAANGGDLCFIRVRSAGPGPVRLEHGGGWIT